MVSHADDDKYATPFSRVAQRMQDDETTVGEDDDERNERMRRTFIHKFVHSKETQPRARQLMKWLSHSENMRQAEGNAPNGSEHDDRLVSMRVFEAIAGDDYLSDSGDEDEKRVFRGTFELETEQVSSDKGEKGKSGKRHLFGRSKSRSPKRDVQQASRGTSPATNADQPSNASATNDRHSPLKGASTSSHSPGNTKGQATLRKGSLSTSMQSSKRKTSLSTSNAHQTRRIMDSLEPDRVRWFYRDAAVKKWTPFCGYDSLRLECKYRELATNIKSATQEKRSRRPRDDKRRPRARSKTAADPLNVTQRSIANADAVDGTQASSAAAAVSASSDTALSVSMEVRSRAQTDSSTSTLTHTLYASMEETDADERATLIGATFGANSTPASVKSETESDCESESETVGSGSGSGKRAAKEAELDDSEPIIVRGGLYEVHVGARTCRPIYWNAEESQCTVMRGSWFNASSGEALEEVLADVLEREHLHALARFAQNASDKDSSGLLTLIKDASARFGASFNREGDRTVVSSKDVEPPGTLFPFSRPIHEVSYRNYQIEWRSFEEVILYEDSGLLNTVLPKFGVRSGGTRLRRGYSEPCFIDDKPPEITHLVFVIHGIGQKAYSGAIVKCCDRLRANAVKLFTEYYPDLQGAAERVEFVPVEWRSALKLDGDTVASVTPPHMSNIRTMLNSTAMDILYYTSPLYRAELTAGLKHELLRLYTMFCARNPYFEQRGQVSVIAHSLGAVMFYDILTGWNPVHLYKQTLSKARPTRSPNPTVLVSRNASVMSLNAPNSRFSPAGSPVAAGATLARLPAVPFTLDTEADDESIAASESDEQSQMREFDSLMVELDDARKRVNMLEARLLSIAERQHLLSTVSEPTDPTEVVQPRRVIFPKNCVAGCYWKQLPKIANFFCLGSPLSVFLALRGVRPKGRRAHDEVFPPNLVHRVYNIYHPCDPIAYRLEPLLLKHYATIKPLYIHAYYDALQRTAYAQMSIVLMNPNATADASSASTAVNSTTKTTSGDKSNTSGGANNDATPTQADKNEPKQSIRRSGMGNFFSQAEEARPTTVEDNERRAQTFSTELKAFRMTRSSTNLRGQSSSLALDSSLRSSMGWDEEDTVCTCRYDADRNGVPTQMRHAGCPLHDVSLPRGIGQNATAPSAPMPRVSSAATMQQQISAGISGLANSEITDSIDYSNVEAADLEYRLDYEVKDSELSIYLAILRAHTSYWRNLDVLQFILQHLFPEHTQSRPKK